MTDLVLTARMRAAGLEPTLYTDAERERIAAAMRALPPPPSPPVIPSPALPRPGMRHLADALDRAVGGVLAALADDGQTVFARDRMATAVEEAISPILLSLPHWEAEAADLIEAGMAAIDTAVDAIDAAHVQSGDCACLLAAAQLCGVDTALYAAALAAHTDAIAAAEAAIADAGATVDAFAAIFDERIPALLAAILPLSTQPADFSPITCRGAALALRDALRR